MSAVGVKDLICSLDDWEQRHVAGVGVERRLGAMRKQRTEPDGTPERDLWGVDIDAAAAEFVVSRTLARFWISKIVEDLSVKPADVAPNIEVRHTRHATGYLRITKRDLDARHYFLVTGTMPTFTIRGWISAEDGKVEQFWKQERRGGYAYCVPQSALLPFPVRDEVAA